jgi:hypothetical protein
MFLTNKYSKIYYAIISRANSENRSKKEACFESHHIIPKSLGGANIKSNLALLTPKEHFICHLLLVKMTEHQQKAKMVYAITTMRYNRYGTRYNSNLYHFFKEHFFKSIRGENHPLFGKERSEETKKLISERTKAAMAGKPGPNTGKKWSEERIEKWKEIVNKDKGWMVGEKNGMFGKKHSDKTKEIFKKINAGTNNPCYGVRIVYNLDTGEKKRIQANEMEIYNKLGFFPKQKYKYKF